MGEISAAMSVLGKEAASALTAVEAQQQRLTLQRLIAMVEAERSFHQRAAEIFDQLHTQMVAERQRTDSAPPSVSDWPETPPAYDDILKSNGTTAQQQKPHHRSSYFLAEVIHAFQAQEEKELSLTPGDFVVVRQVSPTGWSEGEIRGKAGCWQPCARIFPS
eukprot:TRINITY_DN3210_c0_g2_i1.p1 TRINITY_DN3210_c0_g2~~TRINITY_DN3210_c0_g2_i1.p1  ORF type:complete len:162 (-),score=42.09 TRINITY_DN3210_c0_g2_i1:76-561(-)